MDVIEAVMDGIVGGVFRGAWEAITSSPIVAVFFIAGVLITIWPKK